MADKGALVYEYIDTIMVAVHAFREEGRFSRLNERNINERMFILKFMGNEKHREWGEGGEEERRGLR